MKIIKFYSAVTDEQEIPKVGNIGIFNIDMFLKKEEALKEFPLDIDITSEDSIYDSFKDALYYPDENYLKNSYLKSNLALILPGIYFSYYENPKNKDFKKIKVEVFSILKDVPEFTKFRKDNNYPESSLALDASHRPLMYKDISFLFSLLSKTIYCDTKNHGIIQKMFYLTPDKLFIRINHFNDKRTWLSIT